MYVQVLFLNFNNEHWALVRP